MSNLPQQPQSVELGDIELNIELIRGYKAGDKLCLQLSQFPEAKTAIKKLMLDLVGADEDNPKAEIGVNWSFEDYDARNSRNKLRADIRQRIEEL